MKDMENMTEMYALKLKLMAWMLQLQDWYVLKQIEHLQSSGKIENFVEIDTDTAKFPSPVCEAMSIAEVEQMLTQDEQSEEISFEQHLAAMETWKNSHLTK